MNNKNFKQGHFDLNKEIARHICLAQIASDGGKGIYRHHMDGSDIASKNGYCQKETEILKGIKLRNSVRPSLAKFSYFVEQKPDQNGNTARVVYFHHKNGGEQISFHCFGGGIKRLVGKGCLTRWNKNISASSNAVAQLISLYDL